MKLAAKLKRKGKVPFFEIGQEAAVRLRSAAIDLLLTEEEELTIETKSGDVIRLQFDQILSLEITVPNQYKERVELLHGKKIG